jgi:transposase InsO family protein
MTDNGAPYVSVAHALACRELGLRHIRTRPRRPQTNGKACVSGSLPPPGGAARLTRTLSA